MGRVATRFQRDLGEIEQLVEVSHARADVTAPAAAAAGHRSKLERRSPWLRGRRRTGLLRLRPPAPGPVTGGLPCGPARASHHPVRRRQRAGTGTISLNARDPPHAERGCVPHPAVWTARSRVRASGSVCRRGARYMVRYLRYGRASHRAHDRRVSGSPRRHARRDRRSRGSERSKAAVA